MGWIITGVVACVLFGWYLYHRSRKEMAEETDQDADTAGSDEEYEDLLLTGLVLSEIYDDDEDHDSSDDMNSDDAELMDDDGFDDSGGLE